MKARDNFGGELAKAFAERFDGRRVETHWNIFEMRYVTSPIDGSDWHFTPEHREFIAGFEAAWLAR
jgi:hypothetical protein